MNNKIIFLLKLVSDAEPGSGFGTETVNQLLPRNSRGEIHIPASHMKGLMRDKFEEICYSLWDASADRMADIVFGRSGREGDDGELSSFSISDSRIQGAEVKAGNIARTALDEHGTAKDSSLRVSESIPKGSVFKGSISRHCGVDSEFIDTALRLSLTAIDSIGSNRNRGSGTCAVTIEGETRSPGQLLKRLSELKDNLPKDGGNFLSEKKHTLKPDSGAVVLKICFEAEGPICCPERPVVSNNMISSGFSIPSSAVQGAVLYRLNEKNPELANSCFENSGFRCWPLLPCPGETKVPVRVSQTHRISKLEDENGRHAFTDIFLEDYVWQDVPTGSPLKSIDGVLIVDGVNVELYRSSDMPRIISCHSVHSDEEKDRNLFTVEAMAPMKFIGFISLPSEAADEFIKAISETPEIVFGKSRSIRGMGKMTATRFSFDELLKQSRLKSEFQSRSFIVQSPILVPDNVENGCAETILIRIIEESGWGKVDRASASLQILFGWNRAGKGTTVQGTKRLKACRVISPGSVFMLKEKLQDIPSKLLLGIGAARERGYGSVLPHPGVASNRFHPETKLQSMVSSNDGAIAGYDLFKRASSSGLSASQIAQLRNIIESGDILKTKQYLESQKNNRPAKIWNRWKEVFDHAVELLNTKDKEYVSSAICVWHDLTVSRNGRA